MVHHTARVQIFPDGVSLGRALARTIADRIQEYFDSGKTFLLGCPGGRTPVTTYDALADELAARKLDLRGLVIAMMDDYVVAEGDSWRPIDAHAHNSCRRFAREDIQGVLNRGVPSEHQMPDENVWFPDAAEPEAYDARLTEAGGIGFFILASGAGDGHVAFNPPGSPRESRSRVVQLAEQTRHDNLATFPDFAGIDEVPTHGVTVGIATIVEQSHEAAVLLVGADKQIAFERLTNVETYDPSWPATVYLLIDNAQLYADEAAQPHPA